MKTHMPKIVEVPVSEQAIRSCGLAKLDFSDGYCGQINVTGLTARQVAQAIFASPPRFAVVLLALRNRVVALFGLKTPAALSHAESARQQIGIFPILSEAIDEIVLGLDDKHLDFRIHVSIQSNVKDSRITLSTLIHIHNMFGRVSVFVRGTAISLPAIAAYASDGAQETGRRQDADATKYTTVQMKSRPILSCWI